jgi:hypothetical protein
MKRAVIISVMAFVLVVAGVAGWLVWKKQYAPKVFSPDANDSKAINGDVKGDIDLSSQSQVEEQDGITKLEVVAGGVTIIQAGQSKMVAVGQMVGLKSGDTISTDALGAARIIYPSGSIVRLSPKTTVVYRTPAKTTKLEQQLGCIYVRFRKLLGVEDNFEVETPTAVASVRGTAFATFVKADKSTEVIVSEHQVEVTAKDLATGTRIEESKALVDTDAQVEVATDSAKTRKKLQPAKKRLGKLEQGWMEMNKDDKLMDDKSNREKLKLKLKNYFPVEATGSTIISPRLATPTPTPKPSTTMAPKVTEMPGDGFNKFNVEANGNIYSVACVGATQGSFKVVTDSANDSTCKDNCPVMPLADYAKRNNAFAAINGMYFCPASYPECAGKTNTFDTLFFNSRLKVYLNSENNIYSAIPFLAIANNGTPIFKPKSQYWGRDTGIQAGIAGNPLLLHDGNVAFDASSLSDKQRNTKMNVGALVQKGNHLYMCVASNSTVVDSANIYKALKVDNAMNIDGGGSAALWVNGSYVFGPGRNIPNAVLFVK